MVKACSTVNSAWAVPLVAVANSNVAIAKVRSHRRDLGKVSRFIFFSLLGLLRIVTFGIGVDGYYEPGLDY
jgi:hypothetical protein